MSDALQPGEPARGLTFEDVWAMFQETDRRMRETDRFIRELSAKTGETDRFIKELSAKTEETGRFIKELSAETGETGRFIKELSAKTDREMAETDRRLREMTARTDKQIGELGNRFGELAEHLVTPNIAEKFRALGHTFTRAGPDVEFFDRGGKALTEVDVWLENGEFAMAVEVKSHLRKRDVEDHARRMDILRAYLDERGDTRKLLGAVAGAIVKAELKSYSLEKGFYVIEQSGDTVKIEVPEDFTPKVW
jgi:hypothetical protein